MLFNWLFSWVNTLADGTHIFGFPAYSGISLGHKSDANIYELQTQHTLSYKYMGLSILFCFFYQTATPKLQVNEVKYYLQTKQQ